MIDQQKLYIYIYIHVYIYIYIYMYIYTYMYTFRNLEVYVNLHLSWCFPPRETGGGAREGGFFSESFSRRGGVL